MCSDVSADEWWRNQHIWMDSGSVSCEHNIFLRIDSGYLCPQQDYTFMIKFTAIAIIFSILFNLHFTQCKHLL